MKGVELYRQVGRAVYVEGLSRREAARRYWIDTRTVAKMLAFSVPPGYRRPGPRRGRPSSSIPLSGYSTGCATNTVTAAGSLSLRITCTSGD